MDHQFKGGSTTELQAAINNVPIGGMLTCTGESIEIERAVEIRRAITLRGLNAYLPPSLGNTAMLVVASENVELRGLRLRGNYQTVDQKDRAPMIWIQRGQFEVVDCKFESGTKDGVMIAPPDGQGDIVGGQIADIRGFDMGRDVVSISGGNKGQRVRDVTVSGVSIDTSFLRGAVEVSDGSDNILVRNVFAKNAVYAVDVQDHGKGSSPNKGITIRNVTAVHCKHLLRTANSERGHKLLTLENGVAQNCEIPVSISFTANVTISDLRASGTFGSSRPIVALRNCKDVHIAGLRLNGNPAERQLINIRRCGNVTIDDSK